MPTRLVLAGCAALLIGLIGTASGSAVEPGGGEPMPSVSLVIQGTQRVRLEALPQIVQQGRRVAGADAAKTAITATVRPVSAGREVRLQIQQGAFWQTVADRGLDVKGRAQFAVPTAIDGTALIYRVKVAGVAGLAAVASDPVSTGRWLTPTWTDEFAGSSLSRSWSYRGQGFDPESLRKCSRGDPTAVRVGGGTVRLSVIRDPSLTTTCSPLVRGKPAGSFAYRLNGHIGTEGAFSFTYGVAAARVRFQHLRGQHGSFWLQAVGGEYPGGPGQETDVIEYFGAHFPRGGLTSMVHRYDGDRLVRAGSRVNDPSTFLRSKRDAWWKSYHVFSVQWTPGLLVFRIDGKETCRIRGITSRVPQFPVLSLLASDYEIPHIEDSQLPQHMYVDWVRVWAA